MANPSKWVGKWFEDDPKASPTSSTTICAGDGFPRVPRPADGETGTQDHKRSFNQALKSFDLGPAPGGHDGKSKFSAGSGACSDIPIISCSPPGDGRDRPRARARARCADDYVTPSSSPTREFGGFGSRPSAAGLPIVRRCTRIIHRRRAIDVDLGTGAEARLTGKPVAAGRRAVRTSCSPCARNPGPRALSAGGNWLDGVWVSLLIRRRPHRWDVPRSSAPQEVRGGTRCPSTPYGGVGYRMG